MQSNLGEAHSLTDVTSEFRRGWNCTGILLSLFSCQADSLTVLLPLLLTVRQKQRHSSMDSTSPARLVLGQLLPAPGVIPHCFRLCLILSLKLFVALSAPISQFTAQDLWESVRRHTDKVTGPTKLILDNIGVDTCDISPSKTLMFVCLLCHMMLRIRRRQR